MSHDDIDDTPIAVSNLDTPTADPIAQVLAAHNHYTVLSLPLPTENVAGEVLWDGTSEDVKRAYKKVSNRNRHVHHCPRCTLTHCIMHCCVFATVVVTLDTSG